MRGDLMNYSFPPDVQQLIAQRMALGCYVNEDDVLRDALRVLQEVDDDAAAIQVAIDDWKNGDDGVPLDQAFESVRSEFHRQSSE